MATFAELVSVVHRVYQARGGVYDEGTAPQLMQVAEALYEENRDFVRNATVSELRNQSDVIAQAIQEAQ